MQQAFENTLESNERERLRGNTRKERKDTRNDKKIKGLARRPNTQLKSFRKKRQEN